MKKVLRSPFTYVGLALVVAVILLESLQSGSGAKTLALGTYQQDLAAHQVATATVQDGSDTVTGKLKDGTSYRVWSGLLSTYLPLVVIFGLFLLVLNATQGGGAKVLQFGKAKARTASKNQPRVTFADVAGADEAVAELQEIKEFLEAPARFHALGAKIPRGVLLFGPPGTGKTLLARAVAGEAGVPFYSISGSDFVEMFVGVGASRVRDLFEQAKASAPSIVFMDEIDAVGRHRGAGLGGGHDEREQTLNQLLVELDGFDARGGVILIAATNRPDILDPALLRPGRFDRQIVVDRPDVTGRRQILEVHAAGKPLNANTDLDTLARRTPGFSGADLANLLNEAALLAARRNLRHIGMRECEEAIDRVMAGPERKTLVMSEHDKLVTAYHEAGHVVAGHVLSHADPIHKVSIVARSRTLGLTFTLPEDKFNHSRHDLRDAMAMCLGGRSAEELVFGEPTTGAENDIEKTTRIARAMVTEYGMSDVLGPQSLVRPGGEVFLGRDLSGSQPVMSEHNAALIDHEVRALIDEAHDRARAILSEHRSVLDELARQLMESETLEGPELMAIIGHLEPWPDHPQAPVPGPAGAQAVDSPAGPASASTGPAPASTGPAPNRRAARAAPAGLPVDDTVPAARRTRSTRAAKAPAPSSDSPGAAVKPAPSAKGAGRVRPRPRPETTD